MDTSYLTEECRKKMRDAKLGIARPKWVRDKISKTLTGRTCSEEHRKKVGDARRGKPGYWRGKKNPSHSRFMRESLLENVFPRFNPIACQRIDEYGKKHGYRFQHALNGGEVRVIGYSLDGYDKEKNVVIEYYEKHHKKQTERDNQRKEEIIKHLGCKFIELKEWKIVGRPW